ncbi:MAG: TIGR03960 family B12-binding radical SAM protein [Desulfobacterales bacterium]
MVRKTRKATRPSIESEIGTIRKQWRGKISVALVYPNRYHIGMSNLGFQTVYRLLNSLDHVVCERAFLPETNASEMARPTTVESNRPLTDADIIAFSISFENDYPHLLDILDSVGLPLKSDSRTSRHPLVIAGGVACLLNPEPLAPFIDCFLIGEAEEILSTFFETFESRRDKKTVLKNLAHKVPGAYIPAFYRPRYDDDGTLAAFEPLADVPPVIKRVYLKDLSRTSTCSTVVTPHTTFDRSFLIEVGRGCPHGCRFCSAGFIYRPPRYRPISQLAQTIDQGTRLTDRIGLVGAAVSDLPEIDKLCGQFHDKGIRISFSSLRADRLSPGLLAALKQSKVKTATIAPEAGTDRLRRVINKGLSENDILTAATTLVENGIPNLKLYFMIGLPTETMSDVEAITQTVKKIKHRFLTSSRARKKIGHITVSLNSFVPKPFTPFQWCAMEEIGVLKTKIKKIKSELKKVPNLRINSDVPRWAYIQALLSRGDRKVADILSLAHANGGNWAQTLKTVAVNPDFYVYRERRTDERFPWDFIDHGIKKSFLRREYQRAMQGRATADCQVETCHVCGVCKEDNREDQSV